MKNLNKNLNHLCLKKFIDYSLHVASNKSRLYPDNSPFLAAFKNNFCLIDLKTTLILLKRAIRFFSSVKNDSKKILFIGAPFGLKKEFSRLCVSNKHYFVENSRYGFFSDFQNRKPYSWSSKNLRKQLALIIVFDLFEYRSMIKELKNLNIPIVAFVNSSDDASLVDFPVPANVKSHQGGAFVYNLFYHLF